MIIKNTPEIYIILLVFHSDILSIDFNDVHFSKILNIVFAVTLEKD